MKKLQQLQKKIQEAVPSIMELKLGCEVMHEKIIWTVQDYFEGDTESNGSVHLIHHTTDIPVYVDDIKILGRPITLEDVLVAMEQQRSPVEHKLAVSCKGYLDLLDYKGDCLAQSEWEFNKPLDQQPPETIDFLHILLVKE